MSDSYAYLSQGQLHLKLSDAPVRPIDSKFAESIRERAAQIHNRNSWKTQGAGAKFMSGGLLWGRNAADDPTDIRIDITGISRGCNPGELFYSLSTADIGGVFLLRERATDELRLLHTADFRVRRLAAGPRQESLACVVQRKGAPSSIAVMRADGTDMRDVTQGDTIDDAPHWVPGDSRELVFQSSAIGRNRAASPSPKLPSRFTSWIWKRAPCPRSPRIQNSIC